MIDSIISYPLNQLKYLIFHCFYDSISPFIIRLSFFSRHSVNNRVTIISGQIRNLISSCTAPIPKTPPPMYLLAKSTCNTVQESVHISQVNHTVQVLKLLWYLKSCLIVVTRFLPVLWCSCCVITCIRVWLLCYYLCGGGVVVVITCMVV